MWIIFRVDARYSTADAAIYQWHVVIQEPIRIKDLKYPAEK